MNRGPRNSLPVQLLEMKGIQKRFGGVHALQGVDFDLFQGEIHALVGHNGAGKSTLIKILSGAIPMDGGKILLRGREVFIDTPARAEAFGIRVVYQEPNLFEDLDVAHNVFFGRFPTRGRTKFILDRPTFYRRCEELFARLGVSLALTEPVRNLSAAQQKVVQIARALAFEPEILILDEPTASLSHGERSRLFSVLKTLREQKVGVVYITHRLDEVFSIADRVTVIKDGRLVGTVSTVACALDQLVEMMIGRKPAASSAPLPEPEGEVILEANNLRGGKLRNISFCVHRGEVLGLTGPVGSGRTSVAQALFGLHRDTKGNIRLSGRPFRPSSPAEAIRAGVVLVPEDRKRQGLLLDMSVLDNLILSVLRCYTVAGFHIRKRQWLFARNLVGQFAIRLASLGDAAKQLSGGNQQKVVLARAVARQPRLLILDEPTQGIDVAARAEVHHLIRGLARQGVAILLIASDVSEVVKLADRVLVMRDGSIVKEFLAGEATVESVEEVVLKGA